MESTASSERHYTEDESPGVRLLRARLDAWVYWVERHPSVIVAALAALFLLRLPAQLHLILWYDELHTLYIAQAPTIPRFIELLTHTDLNPPLIYALAHLSFKLFGVTSFAVRVPSILAFFLGSMAFLVFLSRRVGWLWAAAILTLFWYSPYFYFATEARPYGLLLGFFCLTLLSWDSASSGRRRGWGLAGIAIGNSGMMLSHVLAPLSIMPFCIAELARSLKERKIDLAVWAALLLPLAWGLLSFSTVSRVGGAIYPPVFQASLGKAGVFYPHSLFPLIPPLFFAVPVSLLIAAWDRNAPRSKPVLTMQEVPFVMGSLVTPLLVNLALMHKHGPFFDRYCATTALVLYAWSGIFFARRCGMKCAPGMSALLMIVAVTLCREIPLLVEILHSESTVEARMDQLESELPLVAANVFTFLEMDHEESTAFLSRVYYLTDRSSALRYAQTDLMEGTGNLKQYFPIRANVDLYTSFAAKHKHFLVLGTIDRPEDWLLRKLIAEGARVSPAGEFHTQYRDSIVYDVTLAR